MKTLRDAYEVLKRQNPLLRALQPGAPLWKKAILEFFSQQTVDQEIRKALILVAGAMEDDDVVRVYFAAFAREQDDDLRRFMIESLKENSHEKAVEMQFPLLGIKEKIYDRYLRQLAAHNITNAIKFYIDKKPIRAGLFISKLRNHTLNDANTFARMNAAIILRTVGDKRALPDLEKRLIAEKKLVSDGTDDVGVPYVIREIERTIAYLKERA